MKKTYCENEKEIPDETLKIKRGDLVQATSSKIIYLIGEDNKMTCVHYQYPKYVGLIVDCGDLSIKDWSIYHGSVTMEN